MDPKKDKQVSKNKIQDLKNNRINKIKKRNNLPVKLEKGSAVSIHLFPGDVHTEKYKTLVENLPDPPIFGTTRHTYLDKKSSGSIKTGEGKWTSNYTHPNKPLTNYTYIHRNGWLEGVHTGLISNMSREKIISGSEFDPAIVKTIQGGIERLKKMDIDPPIYVYITLLGIEQCIFEGTYKNSTKKGKFTREQYEEKKIINNLDVSIPNSLSEALNSIWREAGWQKGSHHYTDGKWDPKDIFVP